MKRLFSMLMAGIILTSNIAFAADTFKDVNSDIDQYEAIEVLATLDVVEGVGNDKYDPEKVLTRAELSTMLVKAMFEDGEIYGNYTGTFDDVKNHWARVFIDTARRENLVAGYGDNKFGPDDNLTYIQTARIILNALGYGDLEWTVGVEDTALNLKLFENVEVKDINGACNRADAAQIIYNAFDAKLIELNKVTNVYKETKKTFLNDLLGYQQISYEEDGRFYIAFIDADIDLEETNIEDIDEDDILVTNICESYEEVIYAKASNKYAFSTSNRAEKYDIDWNKVKLYVNGVKTTGNDTKANWFMADDVELVGIFDDEDVEDANLIAVYVTYEGVDYIPGASLADIPTDVVAEIKDERNYQPRISTITYFEEDETYVISNKVVAGYVEDYSVRNNTVVVDGKTYDLADVKAHGCVEDDYIVIFYNSNNEIVGSKKVNKNDIYFFDTEKMTYHTYECEVYGDKAANYWTKEADVATKVDANTTGRATFTGCKDCNAEGSKTLDVDRLVYANDAWTHFHYEGCKALKDVSNKHEYLKLEKDMTTGAGCRLECSEL